MRRYTSNITGGGDLENLLGNKTSARSMDPSRYQLDNDMYLSLHTRAMYE